MSQSAHRLFEADDPDRETLEIDDICQSRHKGQETSIAANPSTEAKSKDKRTILAALECLGTATCEKLEDWCDLSHQSCSARIAEMRRDNQIQICGKAKTRSGRNARVYRRVELHQGLFGMKKKILGKVTPIPQSTNHAKRQVAPIACPSCDSRKITFHCDSSFIFGSTAPIDWTCDKCGYKWKASLP